MVCPQSLISFSILRWLDKLTEAQLDICQNSSYPHRWKHKVMFLYQPGTHCTSRGLEDNCDILETNFFMFGKSGQYQEITTASCLAETLGQVSQYDGNINYSCSDQRFPTFGIYLRSWGILLHSLQKLKTKKSLLSTAFYYCKALCVLYLGHLLTLK